MSTAANPGKPAVGFYDMASNTLSSIAPHPGTLASVGVTGATFKSTATTSTLTFTVANGGKYFTANTGSNNYLMFAVGPHAAFDLTHGPTGRTHQSVKM